MEHRDVLPLAAMYMAERRHIGRYMGASSATGHMSVDETVGLLAGMVIAATGGVPWYGVIEADGIVVGRIWLNSVKLEAPEQVDAAQRPGDVASVDPSTAEIMCWIAKEHCGRGIGSIAMREMVVVACRDLGLQAVVGNVHARNSASRRALAHVGFVEGEQKGEWIRVRAEPATVDLVGPKG